MSNIQLLNIDCMKYMKTVPDKYFDLACVDPPYGIGASNKKFMRKGKKTGKSLAVSGQNYTEKNWDNKIPCNRYFEEIQRISKNQIIWGGNYFINHLKNTNCMIVWDKVNGDNLYADCELAWTSFDTAVRQFTFQWHGMLQGDMKNKETRIHPTQKPVKLYEWLLMNYAKEGDKIFDSHLGSASSAIAAENLGFDFVGCELDIDYFNLAKERFEQHKANKQMRLF